VKLKKGALKLLLSRHALWLKDHTKGRQFDVSGLDLSEADLSYAVLIRAKLIGTELCGTNLTGAIFYRAECRGADFSNAILGGACFYRADLTRANFANVHLAHTDFTEADLIEAHNIDQIRTTTTILPEGDLIGWKKAVNPDGGFCIVKLLIPKGVPRSNATGRKCRAAKVKVLEVIGSPYGISINDREIIYKPSNIVKADKFDPNSFDECSGGIHFFITREEAEAYQL
jgi:hypothetical protein